MATTLNNTALVAYFAHTDLINVSARGKQCLIDNGHEQIGFLTVCCTQEQLDKEKGAEYEERSVYAFTSSTTIPSGVVYGLLQIQKGEDGR